MGKAVIIACDFANKKELYGFLDKFNGESLFLKVGMELFYAEGAGIVKELKARGHKIFLDLKLHDIPNTVKGAMKVLSKLNVDIINVHASGTMDMMAAAKSAFDGMEKHPLIIAVTQLTSTDEETMRSELLINAQIETVVVKYAQNSQKSGLDGVVCSPKEVTLIKERCGKSFITVTPGIRFSGNAADDQKRITTPGDAKLLGSDYIVVGRPITAAEDAVKAYRRCCEEFLG
ncbi:MAG: orotidine-5'-phosphate decarboxylase [Clostridia bacterium]